jgi:hypothetical protein
MNLQITTHDAATMLEGTPSAALLRSPDDIVELIAACFEHDARLVLLYAENLSDRFFDLSSGEAGTILQKLRNYQIRLAVVVDAERTPQSARFRELVSEERRGGDFRLFDDRDAAEAWLFRSDE